MIKIQLPHAYDFACPVKGLAFLDYKDFSIFLLFNILNLKVLFNLKKTALRFDKY